VAQLDPIEHAQEEIGKKDDLGRHRDVAEINGAVARWVTKRPVSPSEQLAYGAPLCVGDLGVAQQAVGAEGLAHQVDAVGLIAETRQGSDAYLHLPKCGQRHEFILAKEELATNGLRDPRMRVNVESFFGAGQRETVFEGLMPTSSDEDGRLVALLRIVGNQGLGAEPCPGLLESPKRVCPTAEIGRLLAGVHLVVGVPLVRLGDVTQDAESESSYGTPR
jgi:hypothetical protein